MQVSKEAILSKTHYGLGVYGYVLRQHYPGETVLSLSGRDCKPTKNPFNSDKPTLKIQIVDNCACHTELEDAIPEGDAFSFASRYLGLEGQDLYNKLDEVLYLRIGQPFQRPTYIKHPAKAAELTDEKGQPVFSYFKAPILNVVPEYSITPFQVYSLVRGDVYKPATIALRAIADPKEARRYKAKNFRYVTFSGTFDKRSDAALVQHSGLMVIDFDHLPDVEVFKQRLLADEYFETVLLFTSPSGDGLKWVVPVDLAEASHAKMFAAIAAYIKAVYGVTVDPSGKDVSRACFLPYDPNVYLNPKYQ